MFLEHVFEYFVRIVQKCLLNLRVSDITSRMSIKPSYCRGHMGFLHVGLSRRVFVYPGRLRR